MNSDCDCAICYEPLKEQEGNYLRLKCKHCFHFECIVKLVNQPTDYNNKCPMCRTQIIDENKYPDENEYIIKFLVEREKELREYIDNLIFHKQILMYYCIMPILTFVILMVVVYFQDMSEYFPVILFISCCYTLFFIMPVIFMGIFIFLEEYIFTN